MTGKWVQGENAQDEKVDVYVWIDDPPTTGSAGPLTEPEKPSLYGPDGKALVMRRRPMGFRVDRRVA